MRRLRTLLSFLISFVTTQQQWHVVDDDATDLAAATVPDSCCIFIAVVVEEEEVFFSDKLRGHMIMSVDQGDRVGVILFSLLVPQQLASSIYIKNDEEHC